MVRRLDKWLLIGELVIIWYGSPGRSLPALRACWLCCLHIHSVLYVDPSVYL